MPKEMTFGEFLIEKRKREKMTVRQLSALLSLSPTFVSHVEQGKRMPSRNTQIRMAQLLQLNDEERITMFDLAAKAKIKDTFPIDIADYFEHDGELYPFLRKAHELGYTGGDLLKLL